MVKRVAKALENAGYIFHDASPASEHDVLLVHAEQHLKKVKSKDYFDPDTPPLDIKYPLIVAGCTIKAAKLEGFCINETSRSSCRQELSWRLLFTLTT